MRVRVRGLEGESASVVVMEAVRVMVRQCSVYVHVGSGSDGEVVMNMIRQ